MSHPRLFLGPEGIPEIRARAGTEPYRAFYQRYMQLRKENFDLTNPELDPEMMSRHAGALKVLVEGRPDDMVRVRRQFIERIDAWDRDISRYDYAVSKRRPSLMISRRLQVLCVDYDLLAGCDVFTVEQETRIREVLGMVAGRLMERGDSFNPYDYMSDRFRPDNWNSDRMAAVGMFALAFPEHPSSPGWLKHAAEEVVWQLEHTLLPDGSWPEGTRYQGAVLRAFVPFAAALRRNTEIDLFQHPRFKALLASMAGFRTPPLAPAGNVSVSPGVSNANWETIWFAPLAWSAPFYKETDPQLAGRLMHAWRRAGAPWVTEYSPGNPMVGFFLIDASLASMRDDPAGTCLPGGWAILRGPPERRDDWYLLFNVGTPRRKHQHQHYDRGSFSLFAHGTPIAIDPGVRDYDQTLHDWYMRSKAHNLVVFGERDHPAGGRITAHVFSNEIDYVGADLSESVGQPYQRHLFYLKPDVLVVWDRISGDTPATYHLHICSEHEPERSGKDDRDSEMTRLTMRCSNNVNLDWMVISPPRAEGRGLLDVSRDPHAVEFHVEKDFVPKLVKEVRPHWFQLGQSRPREDFVTILHPREHGTPSLRVISRCALVSDENGPDNEAYAIELDLGDRMASFRLNTQEGSDGKFDGTAACAIGNTTSGREFLLLIEATAFRGQGWDVHESEPVTKNITRRD